MSLRAQRGNLIIKGGFDESNPYNFFYEIAKIGGLYCGKKGFFDIQ
jgi:hypothetical protein